MHLCYYIMAAYPYSYNIIFFIYSLHSIIFRYFNKMKYYWKNLKINHLITICFCQITQLFYNIKVKFLYLSLFRVYNMRNNIFFIKNSFCDCY